MSLLSDSTLEFTWHQYCAIGEGKLGVELEKICLTIFAYQSDWDLLTAFLDTVRETEYVILSRPNHSCISKNHPILLAAPSLEKPHHKHDESCRANIVQVKTCSRGKDGSWGPPPPDWGGAPRVGQLAVSYTLCPP